MLDSIWSFINKVVVAYVDIFVEMAPYFVLGLLFTVVIKAYVPTSMMYRHLGQNRWSTIIKAALIGVPLPLCSCGVIPTGLGLYRNGASKSATVSFLISTPQTGIDSIFTTYGLLGLPLAILRPIAAFFNGILGGLATRYIDNNVDNYKHFEHKQNDNEKVTLMGAIRYVFVDFLADIWQPLLAGVLLSALLTVFLSDSWFSGYNSLLIYPAVLLFSVPLYVCATGSIPIAMVLIIKGLSPGAAMLFLIAGPATNIATITILKKMLGNKTLVIYIISIIIGAFLVAIFIDFVLPFEWFTMHNFSLLTGHNHSNIYFLWLKWLSSFVLLFSIGNHVKISLSRFFSFMAKDDLKLKNNNTYKIEGMNCSNCERKISQALEHSSTKYNFSINRKKGELLIDGININHNEIIQTITNLGYSIYLKK